MYRNTFEVMEVENIPLKVRLQGWVSRQDNSVKVVQSPAFALAHGANLPLLDAHAPCGTASVLRAMSTPIPYMGLTGSRRSM
jgi:hypothetical protein